MVGEALPQIQMQEGDDIQLSVFSVILHIRRNKVEIVCIPCDFLGPVSDDEAVVAQFMDRSRAMVKSLELACR